MTEINCYFTLPSTSISLGFTSSVIAPALGLNKTFYPRQVHQILEGEGTKGRENQPWFYNFEGINLNPLGECQAGWGPGIAR